jgi:hypothetical protein
MGQPENDADIASLYQALGAELQEVLRKASGAGSDREQVKAAVWKAYEAWVRAAHASIEKLVAMPAVGDAAAAVLNTFLRAAQIGNRGGLTVRATVADGRADAADRDAGLIRSDREPASRGAESHRAQDAEADRARRAAARCDAPHSACTKRKPFR